MPDDSIYYLKIAHSVNKGAIRGSSALTAVGHRELFWLKSHSWSSGNARGGGGGSDSEEGRHSREGVGGMRAWN